MGGNSRNGRSSERGASLVEFAMLAPVLFLMLFGIVELARLGYAFSEVWTASREGARFATTVGDADGDGEPNFVECLEIEQAALSRVVVEALDAADVSIRYLSQGGALLADCQVGPFPTDSGNIDPGTEIEVTVVATFDAITPLLDRFLDGIVLDNTQIRSVNYGVIGD